MSNNVCITALLQTAFTDARLDIKSSSLEADLDFTGQSNSGPLAIHQLGLQTRGGVYV